MGESGGAALQRPRGAPLDPLATWRSLGFRGGETLEATWRILGGAGGVATDATGGSWLAVHEAAVNVCKLARRFDSSGGGEPQLRAWLAAAQDCLLAAPRGDITATLGDDVDRWRRDALLSAVAATRRIEEIADRLASLARTLPAMQAASRVRGPSIEAALAYFMHGSADPGATFVCHRSGRAFAATARRIDVTGAGLHFPLVPGDDLIFRPGDYFTHLQITAGNDCPIWVYARGGGKLMRVGDVSDGDAIGISFAGLRAAHGRVVPGDPRHGPNRFFADAVLVGELFEEARLQANGTHVGLGLVEELRASAPDLVRAAITAWDRVAVPYFWNQLLRRLSAQDRVHGDSHASQSSSRQPGPGPIPAAARPTVSAPPTPPDPPHGRRAPATPPPNIVQQQL